ncbi:MAG: hypothetical protein LBU27_08465, partial [Candidatus Peribacteria bacterium]|nr:hypothetical protein [Candidatus Peribacteria bacterium]
MIDKNKDIFYYYYKLRRIDMKRHILLILVYFIVDCIVFSQENMDDVWIKRSMAELFLSQFG